MKCKYMSYFNYSVGVIIAVIYSLRIDTSNITPHFDEWLALLFLLAFTSALMGTPLFLLSCLVIAISEKNPNAIMTNEALNVTISAFNSIGVATAYTILLYFLGLTDSFFSFMFFG